MGLEPKDGEAPEDDWGVGYSLCLCGVDLSCLRTLAVLGSWKFLEFEC